MRSRNNFYVKTHKLKLGLVRLWGAHQQRKLIRWSSNFSLSSLALFPYFFVVNAARHVLNSSFASEVNYE